MGRRCGLTALTPRGRQVASIARGISKGQRGIPIQRKARLSSQRIPSADQLGGGLAPLGFEGPGGLHVDDVTRPEFIDQWGTANVMNEFVATRSFNDPDRGVFAAPPM
ncbi:hypothetical protein GCM10011579_033080 [Streptomyces albiflavescens]|uniref:Uncharacterized protein n=1 Tax=Streptomyces albiflavescens TaxID=1623582 RepID=A0A917Y3S9_9ACTN|nr:hypothetical protein GCM10011579_033080 [Streptomyces albiflavescens]